MNSQVRARRWPSLLFILIAVGLIICGGTATATGQSVAETEATPAENETLAWGSSNTTETALTSVTNEIQVTYDVSRTPADQETVRINYTAIIPADVVTLEAHLVTLDAPYTVESTDGMEYDSESGVATAQSSSGTRTTVGLTYTIESNTSLSFGGVNTVETADWAFLGPDQLSMRHRFGYYGALPTVTEGAAVTGDGYAAGSFTFAGPVKTYNRTASGQSFTLVVPTAADASVPPAQALASLANASAQLQVDDRDPRVTAFAAPDPIRRGGQASGATFWVHESSPRSVGSTWHHEYVHTRQAWVDSDASLRAGDDVEWLTEASADYYAGYLGWQANEGDVGQFHEYIATDRYAESVLQDANDEPTELKNYYKGRRVLAAVDIQIRRHTDGNHTLMDVIRDLNGLSADEVRYADLRETVVDLTNESTGATLDTYVTTSAAPAIPTASEVDRVYKLPTITNRTLNVSVTPNTISANESTTVTVTVADEGGTGVQDVTVTSSALGVTATTDSNGTATLDINASDGTYSLAASAPGYADATTTLQVAAADTPKTTPTVELTNAILRPGTIKGNTTTNYTLSFTAHNVSADGQPDTMTVTFPTDTQSSNTSVSVVDANGTTVSAVESRTGDETQTLTVNISRGENKTSSGLTVTLDGTLATPTVTAETTMPVRVSVTDSATGEANTTVDLTIRPEQSAPTDPRARVLQIANKSSAAALTQDDVTTVITLFSRGQTMNSIDIRQDDVSNMITLFERY